MEVEFATLDLWLGYNEWSEWRLDLNPWTSGWAARGYHVE